jgi:hypothetical protein
MSYNLGLTKQVMYRLKRSLGVPVRLVQVGDATSVDYSFGTSVPVYTILNLDRVIKMPASMLRTFTSDFAGMSGGALDFTQSVFIIDMNDLPSDGKHWQISLSLVSDDRQVVLLQVEALRNKLPEPRTLTVQGIGFQQVVELS